MEFEDPTSKSKVVETFLKGVFINALFLLIDSIIFWATWTYIGQPKFNLPHISSWEAIALIYTYNIVFRTRKV